MASGNTDLQQVAAQTILTERTRQPREPENAAFESRLADPSRNPWVGWNQPPTDIRSYRFSRVVLDGEHWGLLNANGFILRTGYLLPDHFLENVAIDETRLVRADDNTPVIVGANVVEWNYFHWVTQALPAIDIGWQREAQPRALAVALPPLNQWQRDSLDLLGCDTLRRITIENDKQYAFETVEFSDVLNGGAAFCLSEAAGRTYARLRQSVAPAASTPARLYVARTDAEHRKMRNEDALIAELVKRGFEIVVPGSLSFADQVRLFRGASLVVGPHGAGMTNIVFCEAGTVVYELVPDHYHNACFCNLASICRLRYWADSFADPVATEADAAVHPSHRKWQSDTAMVLARVSEIEALMAARRTEARDKPISAMDFLSSKAGCVPIEAAPVCPAASRRTSRVSRFLSRTWPPSGPR
jgi:capsular polysaccharide biosynthesis protein